MANRQTLETDSVAELVDFIIRERGRTLRIGLPLGVGKPNHIVNELVQRALDGELDRLVIFTALSLQAPGPGDSALEKRLMEPIVDRLYAEYPGLLYAELRQRGELPDSVVVNEFYYPPGSLLSSPVAQRNYISVNFTDAYREMATIGLDVIAQMVAPSKGGYDLSSNPDITIELIPMLRDQEKPPLVVAQVNRQMPAMGDSAMLKGELFDAVLDNPELDFPLFSLPSMPPEDAEYAIALRVASLLRDGGTVQIGIGNLGEAVAWSSILRHRDPDAFEALFEALEPSEDERALVKLWGGIEPFDNGLYGSTEMFVEGLLHMYEAGVLSREVDGSALHAAFFLGSARFYELLHALSDDDRAKLSMTSVLFTNLLFGDEEKKRADRAHARFINEGMMVTLGGSVVSDGLEDGRVVSGVGGQFEFVAQANALVDARSILMISATRTKSGEVTSNIVYNYGHVTIPRHLRDIIVTEYGVADLRGKTDEDVAIALIEIADSRFQMELLNRAVENGKVSKEYTIPDRACRNLPETLGRRLAPFRSDETLPRTPFDSALSDLELDLVDALRTLKAIVDDTRGLKMPDLDGTGISAALDIPPSARPYLERMGLADAESLSERLLRAALVYALSANDIV